MLKTLLPPFALSASIAFANEPIQDQNNTIQYSVEAEIFFRPWSTKIFGELIGTEHLTVITTPDESGDIVILYKSASSDEPKTEIYRPDTDSPGSWDLVSEEQDKSLHKQADGAFHLREFISGKDGGVHFLRFRLDSPSQ